MIVITPPPVLFVPLSPRVWANVIKLTTLLSIARTTDSPFNVPKYTPAG